jgi:hypothetical protein
MLDADKNLVGVPMGISGQSISASLAPRSFQNCAPAARATRDAFVDHHPR